MRRNISHPFLSVMLLCAAILIVSRSLYGQGNVIRFTAMTYNTHHGQGTDNVLDLNRIARVIDSVNPYYAALQEIDSVASRTGNVDQPARYAQLTGRYCAFAKAIPLAPGSYGNAMLSKAPPADIRRLPLPGSEARVALFTDVDVSNGSDPLHATVTFVATHFMNGELNAQLQAAQSINSYVTNPANGDTGRPMMLLGDLNCSSGSSPINELRTKWSAGNFDYGIDWIMFRPASRWRFVSARKPNTGDAAIASDHLPVETVMELIIPQANNGFIAGLSQPLHTAMRVFACRGGMSVSYLPEADDPAAKVGLFTIRGRCLKSVYMSGSRTLFIPLEGLPGQLYIVKMKIGRETAAVRVPAIGNF